MFGFVFYQYVYISIITLVSALVSVRANTNTHTSLQVISVGNRPSLVPFHERVLRLQGDGLWALETPEEATENAE